MWVVCINNGVCDGASSDLVSLTIGKQYYVPYLRLKNITDYTGTGPREYRIVNDIGVTIFYSSNRFVTVLEYREKQLMELLKF